MILKHRDKELLRFEWVEPQGVRVVSINADDSLKLPRKNVPFFGAELDLLLSKSESLPCLTFCSIMGTG